MLWCISAPLRYPPRPLSTSSVLPISTQAPREVAESSQQATNLSEGTTLPLQPTPDDLLAAGEAHWTCRFDDVPNPMASMTCLACQACPTALAPYAATNCTHTIPPPNQTCCWPRLLLLLPLSAAHFHLPVCRCTLRGTVTPGSVPLWSAAVHASCTPLSP